MSGRQKVAESPRLDMKGSYELTAEEVERIVDDGRIGNYALGHRSSEEKSFIVDYVGRSDSDVKSRLLYWVENSKRPRFKYSYASSAKEAFEKECCNYHDFSPSDNDIHPDKPKDKNYKCPVCGQ
jgi:hypothetical protein